MIGALKYFLVVDVEVIYPDKIFLLLSYFRAFFFPPDVPPSGGIHINLLKEDMW